MLPLLGRRIWKEGGAWGYMSAERRQTETGLSFFGLLPQNVIGWEKKLQTLAPHSFGGGKPEVKAQTDPESGEELLP